MSNLVQVMPHDLTDEQIDLIKSTVAKGSSNDELKLFLYRCKNMGLDPLKPGQIHFVKYGNSPGSIVVGIDGFRSKAARTGKHAGTKRGVLRDEKGKCIGAWCEIYRSDWTHPAREEVSLSEYNTGKAQWLKMPETMIKKVAEVAALRMAFPDELGGIYSDDEMQQANQGQEKAREVTQKLAETHTEENHVEELPEVMEESDPISEYVRKAGNKKGKKLSDLKRIDHENFIKFCKEKIAENVSLPAPVLADAEATEFYLERLKESENA